MGPCNIVKLLSCALIFVVIEIWFCVLFQNGDDSPTTDKVTEKAHPAEESASAEMEVDQKEDDSEETADKVEEKKSSTSLDLQLEPSTDQNGTIINTLVNFRKFLIFC